VLIISGLHKIKPGLEDIGTGVAKLRREKPMSDARIQSPPLKTMRRILTIEPRDHHSKVMV